jgi:hypothetical protein
MFTYPPTFRWDRLWSAGTNSWMPRVQSMDERPAPHRDAAGGAGFPASATRPGGRRVALYGVALTAVCLGACASMPPLPTAEMTRAESAIEQAQKAGAAELAPGPLEAAQRNLSAAKLAVSQHENARAAQLVDEAFADARLADLTAQSEKSARMAAEVDKSIRTLENETSRPRSP